MATKRATPHQPAHVKPGTIVDTTTGATAAKRIVELMRTGVSLDHAGLTVGLTFAEVRQWMRQGLNVRSQVDAGYTWRSFTRELQEFAVFAHEATVATGQWIASSELHLEELARGVRTTETITHTDNQGTVLLKVSKSRTNAPDARTIMWRLSARYPDVYGTKSNTDAFAGDTADDEDVVSRLREKLTTMGTRLALNAGPADG